MKRKKKNKAPELKTYLELNKKYGYGYQGHLIMNGVIDSIIDDKPFTLEEAYSGVVYAIEEINKETGYNYDPHKVISVTDEALRANKERDFKSAVVLKDIEKGKGELAAPCGSDYRREVIDGKEEILLSTRGTLLVLFLSWREDKMSKAREALKRYCEYLAMHRYGKNASDIWEELEKKDKESGANWIKATYGKYIKDNMAVMKYILG